MSEYDYGYEEKKKTFVNDDQKTFWEAFSSGAKEGETRTFFTGNIQTISNYMQMERERNKDLNKERWAMKQNR